MMPDNRDYPIVVQRRQRNAYQCSYGKWGTQRLSPGFGADILAKIDAEGGVHTYTDEDGAVQYRRPRIKRSKAESAAVAPLAADQVAELTAAINGLTELVVRATTPMRQVGA